MAQRQREWADRARKALIAALGGVCGKCGSRRRLELDCIRPQGDRHHRMERSWRVSFYRAQAAAGNLQVLCKACHKSKSVSEMWARHEAYTAAEAEAMA